MSNAKHTASKPLRPLPKASTGIAGLDEILGGGLPKGRPTLLCGPAGSGKTLLSMEFLVRGAALFAEPGVFMAFEETQAELVQNMASLGFDLSGLIAGGKLLVDFVHIAREEIKETGEYNLEGLFVRLGHAIDAIGAKRVVLDTVETLFYGLPNRHILRTELRRLFRWLKDRDVTAVITGEYRADGLTRHGLEEYVSDCVILLDHRVVEQISTRRLRVLKYRGSWHGTNEYPFIIDAQGFTVMPITSLGLHYPAYSGRISSGIPRLDALLEGGGFYRGSTLLVSGTAGTGKTSFAAHFAAAACQRDERALFFAFEEPPRQIMRNMHSIGVDLQPYVEKELLHFAAARPTACGLEAHLARAYRIIAKFQPKVVIADPINAFLAVNNEYAVKAMLIRLVDFLKRKSITAMFTSLTAGGRPLARTDTAISSFIDSWLLLTDLEKSGARKRSLYILKSRGMAHSHRIHEYLITDRGIELTDPTNLAGIYAGLEGVSGGPAPYVREAQAQYQPAGLPRRQETARRRRELACKRQALETQVAAMRKALSSKEAALRQVAAREQQQGARLPQNCAAATLGRHAAQNQTGGTGMTDSNIEQAAPNRQQIPEQEKTWRLRLYVAGQTPRSLAAFANLKSICEKHLPGGYTIEVVDLLESPQLSAGDQILAIPTLVRKLPPPLRKIVGSLANTERVLVGLDLKPRGPDRDNK